MKCYRADFSEVRRKTERADMRRSLPAMGHRDRRSVVGSQGGGVPRKGSWKTRAHAWS